MGKRIAACVVIASVLLIASAAAASFRYRGELRRATKNGMIFDANTWDARIIWHATFFSEEFRRTFDGWHMDVNHLDPAEGAQFVAEQERRQNSGWDFFISFYTKKDYKKFSIEPDSFWKIVLTPSSGEVVRPEAIEAIPITPYEKVMYPHLTRWSRGYRVTFPKVDLGREFTLTIESVVGESTLKWKVK